MKRNVSSHKRETLITGLQQQFYRLCKKYYQLGKLCHQSLKEYEFLTSHTLSLGNLEELGCFTAGASISSRTLLFLGDFRGKQDPLVDCARETRPYEYFVVTDGGLCFSGEDVLQIFSDQEATTDCRDGLGGKTTVSLYLFKRACLFAFYNSLRTTLYWIMRSFIR